MKDRIEIKSNVKIMSASGIFNDLLPCIKEEPKGALLVTALIEPTHNVLLPMEHPSQYHNYTCRLIKKYINSRLIYNSEQF